MQQRSAPHWWASRGLAARAAATCRCGRLEDVPGTCRACDRAGRPPVHAHTRSWGTIHAGDTGGRAARGGRISRLCLRHRMHRQGGSPAQFRGADAVAAPQPRRIPPAGSLASHGAPRARRVTACVPDSAGCSSPMTGPCAAPDGADLTAHRGAFFEVFCPRHETVTGRDGYSGGYSAGRSPVAFCSSGAAQGSAVNRSRVMHASPRCLMNHES
jgi:hypothetical protein